MVLAGRDPHDVAGDPAEPGMDAVLDAARGHQLHADTDAEERLAALDHLALQASTMPGTPSRPARQSAKAPTPGSTMRSAAATSFGLAVTSTRSSRARFARGALEGLGGGAEIARAVIDDGDGHAGCVPTARPWCWAPPSSGADRPRRRRATRAPGP